MQGESHAHTPGAHLAKTAFAQHHQEVEVSQLHAILVAVGVEPGRGVGRLAVGVLARANLRPLDEEEKTAGRVTDVKHNGRKHGNGDEFKHASLNRNGNEDKVVGFLL